MRKRITPGALLGIIAVVFCMTGGAYAANSLITSKDIKDGSIRSRDLSSGVKKKLNKHGSLKVTLTLTVKPASGDTSTETKTLTLKK